MYVEKYFTADTRARTLRMVHADRDGDGGGHQVAGLDVGGDQEAGAREAARRDQQDRPSGEVARLLDGDDRCRTTSSATPPTRWRSRSGGSSTKIGKPLVRGEWYLTPPTVNANYDPQMNEINFPAGVLQPPAFDPKMDDAPNYGNTGGTIGHELTHGFDDEGRRFDARGNLRDWWTEADGKEFERRASCVSDQYSSYVAVDDVHVNGKLTLGEDVADLGGLILAYRAWLTETAGKTLDAEGRPDAVAALLRRLRAELVRELATGDAADARRHRSALAGEVPHQRRRQQHAGVPPGVFLQGGPADGQGAGVQGLVSASSLSGGAHRPGLNGPVSRPRPSSPLRRAATGTAGCARPRARASGSRSRRFPSGA